LLPIRNWLTAFQFRRDKGLGHRGSGRPLKQVNLLKMHHKYTDVMKLTDIVTYLRGPLGQADAYPPTVAFTSAPSSDLKTTFEKLSVSE